MVLFSLFFLDEARPKEKSPFLGNTLDLQLLSVDGRTVNLKEFEGKLVLIDFWATWCGPCMRELPEVKEVYDTWHEKGFEIIGISFDQSKEMLLSVLKREHIPWPQYFEESDGPNHFAVQYGINRIPTMWLVDKRGVFREIVVRGKLEKQVKRLMKEK